MALAKTMRGNHTQVMRPACATRFLHLAIDLNSSEITRQVLPSRIKKTRSYTDAW